MTRKLPILCLAATTLMLPAQADLGSLQGATRQEKVGTPRSVAAFARSWGLAAEQLAWANGLSPQGETGTKVTLPGRILPANPPQNGTVVNLAERGMYVFSEGQYKGFYPLAIGRGDKAEFRTPLGNYKILNREKNPTWVAPDSAWAKAMKKEKISAKSAKNPLGEYWFGIDHPDPGYGFHQNMAPETTGDKVSHGCMRLYPEHAKKLFTDKLLNVGDSVRIENRPVVLGKSTSGEVFVSVFPSAYGNVDMKAKLSKELKKEGLLGMVPSERVKSLAGQKTGVPQSLLGRPIGLRVDGKAAEGATPGVRRAGSILVPVALARELDCKVSYQAKTGEIIVSKDGRNKAFSLDPKTKGNKAYRWGNQTMVPARSLLAGLNIPFQWNGQQQRLEIDG